ncbi:uncharacterized mitochondrial protein AtMg00310-like [Lotus japonicus]|uniref:uncharacterized mitochondrial protein AtMg00310-like n=1 Tax=Lotus japonicus TaxID=34305 RepID=UPI00258DC97D|nr:uncharacterized mitochondrial protein AtMg00310-like [Lotus japonicus]
MPAYCMSQVWMPQGVCDKLDATVRNFIWKNRDGRGIHLVGWDRIALPKRLGGIGLRKTRDHNVALLGKHVWEILVDSNKPWVQLMKARYFPNCSFLLATENQGSSVWRGFLKAREVLRPGFEFKIGNGLSSFWHTPWCTPQPLCQLVDFVHFYDVELQLKDIWDGEHWRLERLWTALPANLVAIINEVAGRINPGVADSVRWSGHITGEYSTAFGYNWIIS